jgi:hypothetical protein
MWLKNPKRTKRNSGCWWCRLHHHLGCSRHLEKPTTPGGWAPNRRCLPITSISWLRLRMFTVSQWRRHDQHGESMVVSPVTISGKPRRHKEPYGGHVLLWCSAFARSAMRKASWENFRWFKGYNPWLQGLKMDGWDGQSRMGTCFSTVS